MPTDKEIDWNTRNAGLLPLNNPKEWMIGGRVAQWDCGTLSSPLSLDWMLQTFYFPKNLFGEAYPHVQCFWKITSIK